ncbi:hypothetical protein Desor_2292 [Desulfosporosinus orientis DSM 765]|uniref:FG-GAP repeat protein n=1 Tax=Desulfosporosinus orientis (strain ATCC 19365 / DSM 765 / NCIMB 8382 / VKM B-1628 / Singapore I) TaxID=768706 RepID=G7WBA7_DESOD|nr:hypothetical protein [Desulfosporosinus orientis]AET67888.1 hypothetical protein Desor_2292 [Desulfosporosinus orientis DSM 765]
MFIFWAISGLIIFTAGMILRIKYRKKAGTILTGIGIFTLVIAVMLFIGTLLLVNRDDTDGRIEDPAVPSQGQVTGADWRTWRGYTQDYVLNGDFAVCFSGQTSDDFYAMYDASSGARIATLLLEEYTVADTGGFTVADYNGDGLDDIGVQLHDGQVLMFCYDPEGGSWPEDVTGGYRRYK